MMFGVFADISSDGKSFECWSTESDIQRYSFDCFGYTKLALKCLHVCSDVNIDFCVLVVRVANDLMLMDCDTRNLYKFYLLSRLRAYTASRSNVWKIYNSAPSWLSDVYEVHANLINESHTRCRLDLFFQMYLVSIAVEIMKSDIPVSDLNLVFDQEDFREKNKHESPLRAIKHGGFDFTPDQFFRLNNKPRPRQISVDWCRSIVQNKKAHFTKKDLLRCQ